MAKLCLKRYKNDRTKHIFAWSIIRVFFNSGYSGFVNQKLTIICYSKSMGDKNMLDNQIANERYVIFASDESNEYTKNFLTSCKVHFKELHGRYKGENETSYIINKKDEYLILPLVENQESVLELTETNRKGQRHALLKFATGITAPIGDFVAVTKEEAESVGAYTFDPAMGIYFIAK